MGSRRTCWPQNDCVAASRNGEVVELPSALVFAAVRFQSDQRNKEDSVSLAQRTAH